jgi:putative transposase
VTPHDVHHGLAAARLQARDAVLAAAFAARPERFSAGAPSAGVVPGAVWINKPRAADAALEAKC